MSCQELRLIFFAFAGSILGQILNVPCGVCGKAISNEQGIRAYFKARIPDVMKSLAGRFMLPIIAASVMLVLNLAFRWDLPTRALSFGIALIAAGALSDLAPRPKVIPLSWSIIYGGYFAAIMLCNRFDGLQKDSQLAMDMANLLKDSVVVVGTILGVCMTILWTMDPQNLQGIEWPGKDKVSYQNLGTYRGFAALYMLTHFLFICLAILNSLGLPLLRALEILE